MTGSSSSILSLFPLTDDQRAATTAREAAISVTAGAGSGKTRTLVGRYLALLEAGLPLRSLVAITFTEKAAREMRNRIRAVTVEWLAQNSATTNRELWEEIFSVLDGARISTIHSLCATILRAHPAEAGLDPAFQVLDEGQSAVWRAQAIEAGLAWATTDPEAARLFSFYKEAQVRFLLTGLLENRLDADQVLARLLAEPLESTLQAWAAALDDWLSECLAAPAWLTSLETLAGLQAKNSDDKLELARREVLGCWEKIQRAQASQDWSTLFQALPALRGAISTAGQQGNWSKENLASAREAMHALRDHFDQVLSRLVDKKKPLDWTLDRLAADLLSPVRRLFEQTRSIYQGYKNEAQALDFDDLEQMAAHLLNHQPLVRRRWQREINAVLLVDEFQDTNHRQREIVYALAGFEPGNRHGQEPGSQPALSSSSFFIVGDAKQSIYRFRGADVTVFRQVQADIQAAGGAVINFNLTFRAHRTLVDLTNKLLEPLMPGADDPRRPYDVPFVPLTAHRLTPRANIAPPYLEFQLGLGEDKPAGRQAAAAGLAARLQELQHTGQIKWQDVALLFRASTAFPVYEDALETAGIPFVTVAGRGFYGRPEVRDLLNALTAIADPGDDLAMAGLLRSPAIGLSDQAIYLLRWDEQQQRRPFWTALQNLASTTGLAEDDRQQADFARQLVADLHQQAGRVPVAQLLKAFLDATCYRAALRLVAGGERLRRNIDKLLADAHRSELISVAEFLEYIAALTDVGARESEAPTEAGGTVQLMTIHKAKGLEFPVVVLADAGYTGGFRPASFYLDRELGLLLNLSDGQAQPAASRLAAWREAEQEAAEERRLLYVAATRAMEKLMVSGDVKLSTAKSNAGQLLLSGWLAQLAEVVGLSQVQLASIPVAPQAIPLEWENGQAACTIHPPVNTVSRQIRDQLSQAGVDWSGLPDMLAPLGPAPGIELDEKLQARETDPPLHVWRIVPATQFEVPAWVVGHLTHVALRHWRFPDNTSPAGEADFTRFLRPFALEAGLTDPAAVETALTRVAGLLTRFQTHPFYAQLLTAERHHEVPYSLTLAGQTHSGIIDLLFRTSPEAGWTIAGFQVDRLSENADLKEYAQQKGYDRQLKVYQQAITQQLGAVPQLLLVFLNVGQSVQILSLTA